MKRTSALLAVIVLGVAACDTMNQPISSGDFDPLRPPGSGSSLNVKPGTVFSAGQFVRATMDNTAFFKTRPKGDMDADKLLTRGTSMRVISSSDSYLKVELDSGEVGWVPTVMVEDPNAISEVPAVNAGEFQVYPPVNGSGLALPPVDPAGQPPGGSIPTVIDPEAPVPTPPTAPEPKTGPAPLPPNGEELKAEKEPKLEE